MTIHTHSHSRQIGRIHCSAWLGTLAVVSLSVLSPLPQPALGADSAQQWNEVSFEEDRFTPGDATYKCTFKGINIELNFFSGRHYSYRLTASEGIDGYVLSGDYDPSSGAIYNKDEIVAALNKAADWAQIALKEKPAAFRKTISTFSYYKPRRKNGVCEAVFRWDPEYRANGYAAVELTKKLGDGVVDRDKVRSGKISDFKDVIETLPAMHNAFQAKLTARDVAKQSSQKAIDEMFR